MSMFWLAAVLSFSLQLTFAQPAQIILIRHAEKPEDANAVHLSKEGEQRAHALVGFITKNGEMTRFGLPVALFATHPTRHGHGVRTRETLAPLAKSLHIVVQEPYPAEDYEGLAKSILSNKHYDGKCIMIAWNHTEISKLAAALGVSPEPPKWKEGVFDRVLLIRYDDGKATLKNIPQDLDGSNQRKHADRTGF
ncbi:MAG TPA: hypothetical protein VMZ27_18075 [Candidatus Saccharimonadales bacterium]|nr:hypothetical protein [Candidatus Saccharimonadales bacterium]